MDENEDMDMDNNEMNMEEGQNEQQDNLIKEPQNPLTSVLLRKSLKKLSRTYSGLSYAYIELDLREKELDDIGEELNNYMHLRDINISTNKFSHVNPVGNMTYLVRLDASKNEIRDMEVFTFLEKLQFLQILNLKENKIKELPNLQTNSLTELYLEANSIETCINYTGLPKLRKLNLNQNRLKSCEGLINMPELEVIYLNENNIKSMKGLEKLPKLRKLRLKNNKIENLVNEELPDLPSLEKLNISENKIKDVKQFSALKFTTMKKINVDANPYFDEPNAGAKIEIILQLENFGVKFVNKEEILPEDREQAKTVKEERIQKEKEEAEERERQRIKEEEERREKEEEERKQREAEELERKQKEEEERLERLEREKEAEMERQRQAEMENNQEMGGDEMQMEEDM